MKHCCKIWSDSINHIKVTPRFKDDIHHAETLQGILIYMFGNYCPTCGNKLKTAEIGDKKLGKCPKRRDYISKSEGQKLENKK